MITIENLWTVWCLACAVFFSGFLLAVGMWAGVKFAAWVWGPMNVNLSNMNISVKYAPPDSKARTDSARLEAK